MIITSLYDYNRQMCQEGSRDSNKLRPHLALFEHGDLLLQRDVLLLQLGVVLQQTSLQELVLLDVVTQLIPLKLHHLAVL